MNFKKAAATSSAIVLGATTIFTGLPTSVSAAQVSTELVQEELSTEEIQAEKSATQEQQKQELQEQETPAQELPSEEEQKPESGNQEELVQKTESGEQEKKEEIIQETPQEIQKPDEENQSGNQEEPQTEETDSVEEPEMEKQEEISETEEEKAQTAEEGISLDETNFPDAAFREIVKRYDNNMDGVLTPEELKKVQNLSINNTVLSSVQGIQYFTELTSLRITQSQLTSLDVSGFEQLATLDIQYNAQLSSLNVSSPALKELDCYKNALTVLTMNTPKLEVLKCGSNQLTSLNLNAPNLKKIFCQNNQLQTLSLQTPALVELDCFNNQLTSLDVSGIKTLTSVDYHGNPPLQTLDFRGCNNLVEGYHSDNQETVYISAGMTQYIGCWAVEEHTGNLVIDLDGYFTVNADGSKSVDLNQVLSPTFIKVFEKEGHACFNPETHILTIPAQDKATVLQAGFDNQLRPTKWTFYTDITAVNDCVVKFDSMGGTTVEDQVLKNGDKAAEPAIPVKEGYTFTGWYMEKECKTLYDFSNPVTENLILYAGWESQIVNTPPTITAKDVTLNVGDRFDPLSGVTAEDKEDGKITVTKDHVIANDVDTSKAGTYHVTYKVTDKNGVSAEKTITVTVIENTPPTITAKDVTLNVGDRFDPLSGVTAEDKEDGKITVTKDHVIANDVDTSKAGTYHVTYKVTDKNGAFAEKTITVTVKAAKKTTTTTKRSPQTGDATNVGLLASMLAGSSGVLAVLKGKGRKKK